MFTVDEALFTDISALKFKLANISIELFCAVITLVLAMHLIFGGSRKTRLNRLFARILILHTIMLVCDALAWIFDGYTQPDLRMLVIAGNYLGIVISYANFIFFMDYIVAATSEKKEVPRVIFNVVAAICILCIVAVTVSQFNGIVYYIDEFNEYRVGPWYFWMIVTGPVIGFIFSAVAVYYSRFMSRSDSLTLLSYVFLLPVSSLLQMLFPEFMFYYATHTLTLLITYVNIHIQHERLLKNRELELADARISIMVNQIQPHFLYNTLSVVSDLCRHDPEAARETIIGFSHYLRANLDALTGKETIPFDEEMRHVDTYLSLEKRRFGEKIRVEYITEASDFRLPPLSLQPIVENAVQHGITAREEGGAIVIKAEDCGDVWRVSVVDDGAGFDTEKERIDGVVHVGLQNVRFRLDAMCGGSLDIDSVPGKGTEAVISIPKKLQPDS